MKFSICSIGCGEHANQVHGPSYQRYQRENPEIRLAACCDINLRAAAAFQENFGFARSYSDYIEMLDQEKPAAVALVLPYPINARIAAHVIRKGYPVIMEKPPAASVSELHELREVAEKYPVPHMVAFNRRHMPLIRQARQILQDMVCQHPLHHIRYDFSRHNRLDHHFETTAIHGIDTVRYLTGSDYRRVRFFYQPASAQLPQVVNISIYAEFEHGSTAWMHFCPLAGVVLERAAVLCENQTMWLETPIWQGFDDPGQLRVVRGGQTVSHFSGTDISDGSGLFESNGFYAENKYFFDCIRNGLMPEHDLGTAVQSVTLMQAIGQRLEEVVFS